MSYYSDAFLAGLEANGVKVAESKRFKGVLYKPEKDGLTIYAGQSGELAFKWDRWEDLKAEIDEFKEVYCD